MTPAQPRHPLALLRELVGDWDRERGRHYFAPGCRPLSDYKGHYTYKVLGRCIEQVLAVMTQMESQESALRAQAEADTAWRALLQEWVAAEDAQCEVEQRMDDAWMAAAARTCAAYKAARAALAQAQAGAGSEGPGEGA